MDVRGVACLKKASWRYLSMLKSVSDAAMNEIKKKKIGDLMRCSVQPPWGSACMLITCLKSSPLRRMPKQE